MKAVIVEDDSVLRQALCEKLQLWGAEVFQAADEKSGLALLDISPELLITDIRLPDGNGITIAESASRIRPVPLMLVISGEATPLETFRLAKAGVAAYIPKPINLETFTALIEAVIDSVPDIAPHISGLVGKSSYIDVLRKVRRTMLEQALAKTAGNRVHAARLLDISRQAVQQLIHDFTL